jgi:hypothetical protein
MIRHIPFRIIRQYFCNEATASDEMLMRDWISEKTQHEQLYNALISLYHTRHNIFHVKRYRSELISFFHSLKEFDRRIWIPMLKLVILVLFVK